MYSLIMCTFRLRVPSSIKCDSMKLTSFTFSDQRSMFDIGFTFIYDDKDVSTPTDDVPHSWFNHTNEDYQRKPKCYRVTARFASLKEEALQSGFLNPSKWTKNIEMKGSKYLRSRNARKMTAVHLRHMSSGPRKGAPISAQHIQAIILYCDESVLSKTFSATYRKSDVFESVHSVTRRHSHWWWLGRLLKECVQHFGTDGETDPGPFYCGLNTELNMTR